LINIIYLINQSTNNLFNEVCIRKILYWISVEPVPGCRSSCAAGVTWQSADSDSWSDLSGFGILPYMYRIEFL